MSSPAPRAWTALFGDQLERCSGAAEDDAPVLEPTGPALAGVSALIVYFSFANICARVDELADRLARAALPACVVQVVLCAPSSAPHDRRGAHRRLLRGLPWLAVPFDDVETKRRLTYKFRIKVGAPTLVLIGADGREICRPSREQLEQPADFPWAPRSISQILDGVPLERDDAPPLTYADLPDDCVRAFYFAAHWCPPCKAFTPQLVQTYSLVRSRGHDFRIIFVSSDRSEESFQRAAADTPWLRVGWAATGARRELAGALGVHGIPALRILAPGAPAYEARHRAAGDPDGFNFPWKPGPVSVLCDYYLARLQEQPTLVLFVDGEESEIRSAEAVLLPVADSYFEEYSILNPGFLPSHTTSDEENADYESTFTSDTDDSSSAKSPQKKSKHLQFLIATDSEAADALREQAGLDDTAPLLAAIDVPRNRCTVLSPDTTITADAVQNFLDSYLSGQLISRELQSPETNPNRSRVD